MGRQMTLRWRFAGDCRYRCHRIGAYRDRPTDARHRISRRGGLHHQARPLLAQAPHERPIAGADRMTPIDIIAIVVLAVGMAAPRIRLEMTWHR